MLESFNRESYLKPATQRMQLVLAPAAFGFNYLTTRAAARVRVLGDIA
ncbi:hypothetical protein [Massilia timonae]|uniref:Uncharacterized protein n=1 Tax=Massilia timonae TaxID=47229 RepID=A0A1S2NDF1_9BURK|nr:hypothetical protein [Massilia timonae]OIJ43009.1 hypothetical protein LO55_179 [Massilia timonae]